MGQAVYWDSTAPFRTDAIVSHLPFRTRHRSGHSRPVSTNTEKLELPSISQVHTRGPVDVPLYNSHYSQRPVLSGDRLPNLHLPQSYASTASYGPTTTRTGVGESHSGGHNQYSASTTSSSSYTTAQSSVGLKTPSPSPTSHNLPSHPGVPDESPDPSDYSQPNSTISHYAPVTEPFHPTMNQSQQYLDSHQPHMSAGQSYAPQATTAGSTSLYSPYQQQLSVLQSGPPSYGSSASSYGQYGGYTNGVTSPQGTGQPVSGSMGQQMNSGLLPLPGKPTASATIDRSANHDVAMPPGGPSPHAYIGGPAPGYPPTYDSSGQMAPPGMKPRVTATLWEDEGSMCFQVEAKGVCVARRDGTAPCIQVGFMRHRGLRPPSLSPSLFVPGCKLLTLFFF